MTYTEDMSYDSDKWHNIIRSDINFMYNNQVQTVVEGPKGVKIERVRVSL